MGPLAGGIFYFTGSFRVLFGVLGVLQRTRVLITHWLRKPYSSQREQEDDDNLAQRSKDADDEDQLGNEDQDQQGNQHVEDEDDQKEKDDDDEEL